MLKVLRIPRQAHFLWWKYRRKIRSLLNNYFAFIESELFFNKIIYSKGTIWKEIQFSLASGLDDPRTTRVHAGNRVYFLASRDKIIHPFGFHWRFLHYGAVSLEACHYIFLIRWGACIDFSRCCVSSGKQGGYFRRHWRISEECNRYIDFVIPLAILFIRCFSDISDKL